MFDPMIAIGVELRPVILAFSTILVEGQIGIWLCLM